jgi:hypothetical protein
VLGLADPPNAQRKKLKFYFLPVLGISDPDKNFIFVLGPTSDAKI